MPARAAAAAATRSRPFPRRDNMHTTRPSARTTLPGQPDKPLQPPWRPAHLRKHPCVVHAPPPCVSGDCARQAGRCGCGSAHKEVKRDECVGKVQEGDGDEAEEGGLGARWGESGGEVGEADEEGACEHVCSQGEVESL